MNVLHTCDNPACVRPDHLFLGTHQDNMKDRDKKDRQAKGQDIPTTKLTKDDVRWIKQQLVNGNGNLHDLAKHVSVGPRTVQAIASGKIWKHVKVKGWKPGLQDKPTGKLTADDVIQIRALLVSGEKQRDIANLYGVTQTTISNIKRNKKWKG